MESSNLETDQVRNWVRSAQSGDTHSLTALYRTFVTPIYRFCFWQTQDQAVAEDLTSETFMIMVKNIASFKHGGSFKNWLYTIAKRQVFSWIKEKYHTTTLEEYHSLIPDTSDLISSEAEEVKKKQIETLLNKLTSQEKKVVTLRYRDNYSVQETAQALKLTVSNVKVIAHRAKAKLLPAQV